MIWYSNSEGRFGDSGRKGDQGEDLFEIYLKENKINYEKKTDPYSQTVQKIDFIVDSIPVDVKTNIYKDHLAVEVVNSSGEKGWIFTTQARDIYCVDLENKKIYRYNVKEMSNYCVCNTGRWKQTRNGASLMWVDVNHRLVEKVV